MLPKDFVYLHEVVPSIKYQAYYHSDFNFLGRKVDGYEKDIIIITKKASLRIRDIQEKFLQNGYSLFVMDGYRPLRACYDFLSWSYEKENNKMKEVFYPSLSKKEIIDNGYVSEKSAHCRGSTIDVTLIRIGHKFIKNPKITSKTLPDGKIIPFFDNGSIDMGSSFDLFDEVSHTKYSNISESAKNNRQYLIKTMESFGFKNFSPAWEDNPREWWHFTLEDEPFPDKYFDFIVK